MTQVILITKLPHSIYINKVIPKYPAIHITNYLHRLFTIELTKGPFCSTHTVLTDEEIIKIFGSGEKDKVERTPRGSKPQPSTTSTSSNCLSP